MSLSDDAADLLPGAPLSRAPLLVRRLIWLYGAFTVFIALLASLAVLPIRALPKLKDMAAELHAGGLAVVALSAVLLALTALVATALLAYSRLALRQAEAARLAGEFNSTPPSLLTVLWRLGPGVLARQGQAATILLGALAIGVLARLMWPSSAAPAPISADANLVAALIIGLAFPSLIAERMMNAFPAAQMPEAPGVRRILLLTTLILAIGGVAEIGRGVGFAWTVWIQRALVVGVLLIVAELTLRALARLFLPPPAPETAKAATDSILAALITGGPRAPGTLIRTHLGLDFTRSWALSYLSKAAVPAVVCTLFLCWGLSGVKLLNGDQRGIYERLGAPVKVLGPGFHVLLPWPLGRMRPVEYGTVHIVAVGAEEGPDAFEKSERAEKVGAEDNLPPSMNKLWETAHATEAEYLVASQAQAQGQQEFQAVNGEILVLYRTGMTDAAAWESVYGAASQATVVDNEANRLLTRYFSSHTLDQVMGGQRESLQESLRAELNQAVAADHAGVDIVSVLIDEVHPPIGAAAAYRAVQAARINADAQVSLATAHATRTLGEAHQEAYQATAAATAGAVEKIQAATGEAYQFEADRKAYVSSPPAFLLERRSRNLAQTLPGTRLVVIDSRLSPSEAPLMDFRGLSALQPAAAVAAASAPPAPGAANPGADVEATPGTSTEEAAPPATSEQAAEEAVRPRTTGASRRPAAQ